MNINEMINNIDSAKLRQSMENLMNDPHSKELVEKLKNVDKNQLQSYISSINSGKISTEAILRQIQNNPNIIKQLNDVLSKQSKGKE